MISASGVGADLWDIIHNYVLESICGGLWGLHGAMTVRPESVNVLGPFHPRPSGRAYLASPAPVLGVLGAKRALAQAGQHNSHGLKGGPGWGSHLWLRRDLAPRVVSPS